MRQRASVASVAPVVPKKTRVFPRKPGKKNLPKKKKNLPVSLCLVVRVPADVLVARVFFGYIDPV